MDECKPLDVGDVDDAPQLPNPWDSDAADDVYAAQDAAPLLALPPPQHAQPSHPQFPSAVDETTGLLGGVAQGHPRVTPGSPQLHPDSTPAATQLHPSFTPAATQLHLSFTPAAAPQLHRA